MHGLVFLVMIQQLENTIEPMLTNSNENDQNYQEDQLIFQQDGVPPHYAGFRSPLPGSMEWQFYQIAQTIIKTVFSRFLPEGKILYTSTYFNRDLRQRITNKRRLITPVIQLYIYYGSSLFIKVYNIVQNFTGVQTMCYSIPIP